MGNFSTKVSDSTLISCDDGVGEYKKTIGSIFNNLFCGHEDLTINGIQCCIRFVDSHFCGYVTQKDLPCTEKDIMYHLEFLCLGELI